MDIGVNPWGSLYVATTAGLHGSVGYLTTKQASDVLALSHPLPIPHPSPLRASIYPGHLSVS